MNKEEKKAINELKKVRWNSLAVVAKNEDGKMDISYFTEKHKKTILNLIQKQEKIIDAMKYRVVLTEKEHRMILKMLERRSNKRYEDCVVEYFKKVVDEDE